MDRVFVDPRMAGILSDTRSKLGGESPISTLAEGWIFHSLEVTRIKRKRHRPYDAHSHGRLEQEQRPSYVAGCVPDPASLSRSP